MPMQIPVQVSMPIPMQIRMSTPPPPPPPTSMPMPMLRPGDKVVLATFGTSGDLFPFISIARQLQARGIVAVVATSSLHRALVESNGLAFCLLAPTESQVLADLGESLPVLMGRAMRPWSGPKFGITRIVLPYLAETHAQLTAACRDAALLISHSYLFAAPLVAEQTGIAWRSLCLQPLSLLSADDAAVLSDRVSVHRLQPWLGPARYGTVLRAVKAATRHWFAPVDTLRRTLGLAPTRLHPLFEGQFSAQGVFALFDPILMNDRRGLPPSLRFAGFSHSDGTDGQLPPALASFLERGPPPVVFTLGTSAVYNPGRFYEVARAACLRLGQRAVFLQGAGADSAGLPDTQIAVDWASHAGLFPHAAVVVHQCGIGTVAQALRAGVPQLAVPFANDQPDNAARLVRLGVAGLLRPSRITEGRMADALQRLLADPAVALRARRVATELLPEDGAATVAGWLTTAENTGTPSPAGQVPPTDAAPSQRASVLSQ